MAINDRNTREPRRVSIPLPWIGLAAVLLIGGVVALRFGFPTHRPQLATTDVEPLRTNVEIASVRSANESDDRQVIAAVLDCFEPVQTAELVYLCRETTMPAAHRKLRRIIAEYGWQSDQFDQAFMQDQLAQFDFPRSSIVAYLTANQTPGRLTRELLPLEKCRLAPADTLGSLPVFDDPTLAKGAHCYVRVSRPGYSDDVRWAVVYGECSTGMGDGSGWFFLVRRQAGAWKLVRSEVSWFS